MGTQAQIGLRCGMPNRSLAGRERVVALRAASQKGNYSSDLRTRKGQVDLGSLIIIIGLVTVSVSLFFVTAATVHIASSS